MKACDRAEEFVDRVLEGRIQSYHSDYMFDEYGKLHNLLPEQVVMAEVLNEINDKIKDRNSVSVYMEYSEDGKMQCHLCSADDSDRDLGFEGKGRLVDTSDSSSDLYVITIDNVEKPSDLFSVFEKGNKESVEKQCYTITNVRERFAKAQDTISNSFNILEISQFDYLYEHAKEAKRIRESMETEFVIPKKYGKDLEILKSQNPCVVSGVVILKSVGAELPGLIGSRSDDENIYLSFARYSKDGFDKHIEKMKISTGVCVEDFKKRLELIEKKKEEINKNLPKISMENNQNKSNQRSASL